MPKSDDPTGFEGRLKPAAGVALFDSDRRVLLLRHRHDDRWGTPGGGMEPGETPRQAACREVLEETNLTVHEPHLVDAFGGREFEVAYPGGGSPVAYVVILYGATRWSGNIALQLDEVTESAWVTENDSASIDMPADMGTMLPQAFAWYEQDRGCPG